MGRSKNLLIKIGLGILVFYFLLVIGRDVSKSFYLLGQDRLNVVLFQKEPVYFSYDLHGRSSYSIVFYPDLKVKVPGGYGDYRLGGLLKLAELEKKPAIIQNTFSSLSRSLVDFYYYPSRSEIYFGKDNTQLRLNKLSLMAMLSSKSNASFPERILTYFLLLRQNKDQQLDPVTLAQAPENYQGYFYKESLRNEKINLRLVYRQAYSTAANLSHILEGEGIRVVDIVQEATEDEAQAKKCFLVQSVKQPSKTAIYLARYFGCTIKTGVQTGVYDLVFYLNNLEQSWEINQ